MNESQNNGTFFTFDTVLVSTPERRKLETGDEYDTGSEDGSGVIEITAESAEQITARSAVFRNVVVTTRGDYETWDEDDIYAEAQNHLERDYFPTEDEDDDSYDDDDEDED